MEDWREIVYLVDDVPVEFSHPYEIEPNKLIRNAKTKNQLTVADDGTVKLDTSEGRVQFEVDELYSLVFGAESDEEEVQTAGSPGLSSGPAELQDQLWEIIASCALRGFSLDDMARECGLSRDQVNELIDARKKAGRIRAEVARLI
jgi:hypothetical protein